MNFVRDRMIHGRRFTGFARLVLFALLVLLSLAFGSSETWAATVDITDNPPDPADFSASPGSTGNYINAFAASRSGGGSRTVQTVTVTTTGTSNLSNVEIRSEDGLTTFGNDTTPTGNDWVVTVNQDANINLRVYVDVAGGATPGQTVTALISDFTTNGTKGTVTDVAGTTMTIAGAACTRNAPTFSMGTDQSVSPGGSAVYTLSITNNDTASCSSTTFDLNIVSETGNTGSCTLPSILSAGQVTIAPGDTDTSVTLTVTAEGAGGDGHLLDSTVQVRDDTDHAGQEQTDVVRTTISAACTRNAPGFTMGANQDIPVDGTAVYTLSITNNDTAACPSTTFDTTIIDTQGDLGSFFTPALSAASVTIPPQTQDTSVTLTVTGDGTGTDGHLLDVTVEVKDDTDHLGQQQTDLVRTTIASVVGDGFNLRRSRENLCHSCHKTDLNRSSSDPDWDEAIKTHNSTNTDSTKWQAQGGWGVDGGKYGSFQCITCHTTHFTQNIFLIRERLVTPDGTPWDSGGGLANVPVDFRELSNTPGDALYAMGDDSDNHSTSTRVCEACHTITNYHRYDVTGLPAENKTHNNAKDCTECHNHRDAFKGLGSCVDCHNTARTKTKGTPGTIRQVTGSGGDYERFSRHVINGTTPGTEIVTVYDCTLCHREGSTTDANPVDGVHNDAGGLVNLRNVDSRDTGWDIDNKNMTEAKRTELDTFCLACHDGDGANDIAVTGPSSSPAFALPPTGIQNLTPFNDNDNLNSNNAQRDGFVRSRVIDVKTQFDPGTGGAGAGYNGNPSQHAVLGARYSTQHSATNSGEWDVSAWTSHALRNGTVQSTAKETVTVHCSDCHLTESNAHGAANAWHMLMDGVVNNYTNDTAMGGVALDDDPTILVCYKCHNQSVYSSASGGGRGSRVDHAEDSKWPQAGYGTGADAALLGPQCLNCHAGDGFGNIHGVSGQYDPFLTGQSGAPGNLQGTRFTRYRFMPGAWMLWSPGGGGSGGATGDDTSWNTATNGTCYFAGSSSWSNCTQHNGTPGSTNSNRVTTNYGRPVKY
jgi:hypothetical protein